MSLFLNFVESEKVAPSREMRDCCLDDTSWNDAWAKLLGALPGLLAATFGRLSAPIDLTASNDLAAR
jgi:hypothetical protein